MTDPQNPVEKPDIDDVVERANAGLAEAEAARAASARRVQYPAPNPEQNAAKPDASTPDASTPDAASSDPVEPAAVPAGEPEPTAAEEPHAESAAQPEAAAHEQASDVAASEPAPAAEPEAGTEPAAVDDSEPSTGTVALDTVPADTAAEAEAPAQTTTAEPDADADAPTTALPAETAAVAGGAAAVASAPAPAPVEPAGLTAVAGPRPVYVAAPDAPASRGNRGAAGLIGLVAAVAFAVLYLGVWTLIQLVDGSFDAANYGNKVLDQLSQFDVWTPTVVFFLGFWLLGAFINRARWGYWVVFGILVGAAAYIGHIAGQLAHAQAWNLSYAASEKLVHAELFAPMAIAAFIIGRELTIWFGAWVSARGRKVTALNVAAQEEYERSLEAGPQAAAETR